MIKLIRTDSTNPDFIELVRLLDKDLAIRDGNEHDFYAQYNKIDAIKNVVLAYHDKDAIGCGAMKEFNSESMEIKRMFTNPAFRGKGIARKILAELQTWASELKYQNCILETGKKQPEAIQLYQKHGYKVTENYGQYAGIENSVCFLKSLKN